MLFNSYTFIVLFLPLTLVGFWLLGGWINRGAAKAWLVAASLFFYGWWNPVYLYLIVSSVLFNFAVGVGIGKLRRRAASYMAVRTLLVLGVAANLGVLGYFKYAYFLASNLYLAAGLRIQLGLIVLPLGISFFTFQQIAYLVDAAEGRVEEYNFVDYALFVTFFPQLIAGPIVHHADVLPQFARKGVYRFNSRNLSLGLTYFSIGLFKKVVIADGIAVYATPVFNAAAQGVHMTLFEAWGGVLAYTFQLYFDFSGYSDMAIGLGRMFGIRLPLNFNSPYKALNISEFWRRWHITLSQFLRDYLYIPLGGNRKGTSRRYVNLMITMLLGGLWHGAGWTFVFWGGLHGFYLVVHHAWQALRRRVAWVASWTGGGAARTLCWAATFLAVVVGWVFFRATSFTSALLLLRSMFGREGVALPVRLAGTESWLRLPGVAFTGMFQHGLFSVWGTIWILVLLVVSVRMPNAWDLMRKYRPVIDHRKSVVGRGGWLQWFPSPAWAVVMLVVTFWSVLKLSQISEFLYFQF